MRDCPLGKGKGRGDESAAHLGSSAPADAPQPVQYLSLEDFEMVEEIYFAMVEEIYFAMDDLGDLEELDDERMHEHPEYPAYLTWVNNYLLDQQQLAASDEHGNVPDIVVPTFVDWLITHSEDVHLAEDGDSDEADASSSSPTPTPSLPTVAAMTSDFQPPTGEIQ